MQHNNILDPAHSRGVKANAPGSLMLLGEHAVLFGKSALTCAVDKFMTVTLTPHASNDNDLIEIYSKTHGSYVTRLSELTIKKPFQFVLGAIQQLQSRIRRGFKIEIESEFSDQVGLGSSAAVTVATLACLITWLNMRFSPLDLIRQGRQVIRNVQGVGSGADIAACVLGGIVAYQAQPLAAEKIHSTYPISLVYSGKKVPTVNVIKHVQDHFRDHPELLRQIVNAIGECAQQGAQLVRRKEWQKLGVVFDIQQGLMEALNVSNAILRKLIADLHQDKDILGAKISGSGLGDCVIGLGERKVSVRNAIDCQMTLQGVQCEKI